MKRCLLVAVTLLITAATGQAQDRLVSLMEKFDKRMDVLDAKIQKMDDRLRALEGKYGSPGYASPEPSPKPNYTPSYTPPPSYSSSPNYAGIAKNMAKHPPLPPGFFEIEQDGEIIVIGPPPWAFPNGPPPGLVPIGPIGPGGGPRPGFMANR